ncbi:MAG: type II toxin-antitoxin system mRNA interferase toxin, RelE/StbE family [Candidatus Aegiribacteria sp.]|nr:type II toxin-antitoxin system mRNA interferase toxin, RelE/StbE family [Candidatus Aegiribacteria sp.]MBD3295255.1 type II toxin-antitoxin system mRNA interferase toxin, RelE/StbE family [Candidatus Fermentibacteria bacterium]
MAKYRILIRKSVYKDLDRIPKKDVKRIISAIGKLQDNPRPTQSKKLSGEDKYRLRCGSYRVIYEIKDDALVVYVVKARHRKDVYK